MNAMLKKLFNSNSTKPQICGLSFELVFRLTGTPSRPAAHERRQLDFDSAKESGWSREIECPGGGTVQFSFSETAVPGEFVIDVVHEGRGWVVEEIVGPVLRLTEVDEYALLLPDGLGTRTSAPSSCPPQKLFYPSGRCTMAWSALAGKNGGVYFGRHDADFSSLQIIAAGDGETLTWGIAQKPWIAPGGKWRSAPVVLGRYDGPWEAAADIYKAWAKTWSDRSALPAWPSAQSGWMLTILKQQNQDIYWSYRDLDKVWRLALDHGLTAVGLFGWAHGGHDREYPNYHPDPAMGGETELRRALAEARELGLRTILYANGQLMDTATEFYRWQGNDACTWKPSHEPYVTSIRKFNSCTPVTFALGCHGAPIWQEQMRFLARQAESLGADGILYDQVGVATPADCHHPGHNHANPGTGWTTERVAFYRQLSAEMRVKNPEFVVMTEGVFDALTPHMAWFHGWGTGFASRPIYEFLGDGKNDFPSLFRYIFPDVPLTQRFSTPVLGVTEARHAFLHGLSHEIEARWPADVRYLEDGVTPKEDDYADCTYFPPDVSLMQRVDSQTGRALLRKWCAFANKHAGLFRTGTYLGDADISGAKACRVSARINSQHAAVIAWNLTAEPQSVHPLFRRLEPTHSTDPEAGTPTNEPIPPGALRVFFYQLP